MPFFSFWWKVVCRAADKAWGHFNFLLGLVAIGSGVSVIGFFVQLAKKEEVDMNYWPLVLPVLGFGVLFFWGMVTVPFEIYTENQREIKDLKAKLEAIKNGTIVFDVKIIPSDRPDPFVNFWALRIKVTNMHPTKAAHGVNVRLVDIKADTWNASEKINL